jgi:hypothetical protein
MTRFAAMLLAALLSACAMGWDRDDDGDGGPDAVGDDPRPGDAPADVPGDGECPEGLASCSGTCVDLESSHEHCGECGEACDASMVCSEGECALECPALKTDCSGSCVDTKRDLLNCGACGNACTAGVHATALCESGVCAVLCDPGWEDGDGDGSCESGCTPTSTSELCNGVDDNCDGRTDEGFDCRMGEVTGCTTVCGTAGSGLCSIDCEPPASSSCNPPAEDCNGQDDNCNGSCDESFDCCRGESGTCTTSCGSAGTYTCTSSCTGGECEPPDETCNGTDDNCDTIPDNTVGCRVAVYRFSGPGDHMYSLDPAPPSGYALEGTGWCAYPAAVSGAQLTTVELFMLWNAGGTDHFYTINEAERDSAIAGGFQLLGNAGFCSPSEIAGFTTPVYRLYSAAATDHFYTINAEERDNAVSLYGYVEEGIACFAWGSL